MWIGGLCWLLLFYPVWSRWMRRLRKRAKGQPIDTVSRNALRGKGIPVSRMFTRVDENGEYVPHFDIDLEGDTGTGPLWEQDKPFPEIFEDEEEA